MSLSEHALAVKKALLDKGLETPMITNKLTPSQQKKQIESLMAQVINILGLDLEDDSLQKTPERMAKMYIDELFSGLDYNNFPTISDIENKMQVKEMVKIANISLCSTCEHHFITIDGSATVAYLPKDTVIGLSKINRIVRFFARRPQIQERLSQQILIALQTLLATEDVAIQIQATHYCVKSRGVMDESSMTTTMAFGGKFSHDKTLRAEFLM